MQYEVTMEQAVISHSELEMVVVMVVVERGWSWKHRFKSILHRNVI